jgi:toluene monooxygenase system protein E
MSARPRPQRTYWHLEALGRKPSDYEIATSRLLYHVGRGFEVETPLSAWYARHQARSPLRCADWEAFADPRATTYTKYVELQKRKELFVDGLYQSMEDTGYDRRLSPEWLACLSNVIGPLRYCVHGLQMASAYVGQMAPSGRIVVAALFQAGDEMRFVQRLAYRLRALQETDPAFGRDARDRWQSDPAWQPLRAAIERLLAAYDWGEAFTALNLAIKPILDDLFLVQLGRLAQAHADELFARVLLSLAEDAEWHCAWSAALARLAVEQAPDNRAVLEGWVRSWGAQAHAAVDGVLPLFSNGRGDPEVGAGAVRHRNLEAWRRHIEACGLAVGASASI